MVTVGRKVVQD